MILIEHGYVMVDIVGALTPDDLEHMDIRQQPREADVLLITEQFVSNGRENLQRIYSKAPNLKLVAIETAH